MTLARRQDYYDEPRQNPIRRELCNFLVLHGEPDHFESVRFWSNYQLECLAIRKGWKPSKAQKDQFNIPYSD